MIPMHAMFVLLVSLSSLTTVHAQTESGELSSSASLAAFYRACPEARATVPVIDWNDTVSVADLTSLLKLGNGSQATPQYRSVPKIGVWGDSHTASGDFMFSALQQWGFSKSGMRSGMIQPAMQIPGVRLPIRKSCVSWGWKVFYAQRGMSQGPPFTKTLLQLRSETPNDFLWLDFRAPGEDVRLKWVNIHYAKKEADRALVLGVSVDNGAEQIMNLSDSTEPFLQIKPAAPFATLRIRLIEGQISLHGFAPVYTEAPKILLDIFSTPGAMAKAWNDMDPSVVGEQNYDVVVFQYGTNEAIDPDYNEDIYSKSFRHSLSKFRKIHPKARCILVGPPERGNVSNGVTRTYARSHQSINRVQSLVGKEMGCVSWNWQGALNGPGSVNQLLAASPPLIKKDLIHLTQEGYETSGQRFAKTISWKY